VRALKNSGKKYDIGVKMKAGWGCIQLGEES
jgi:hypothetical protein